MVYLKLMRINKEGIVPYFNKEINEYYLTVGNEISNLEIVAEPENADDIVEIKGNTNLKYGMNNITVEVTSKDRGNKNTYYIYTTKTDNRETANTNLENLALENTILVPEFNNNTSYYKAEIGNEIDNLNILAFPENINANVQIDGSENLQIGKNVITIKVIAENEYTFRRYYIDIYRRNKEEENQYLQSREFQAQRLSTIVEDRPEKNLDSRSSYNSSNNSTPLLPIIGVIIVIGLVVLYFKNKNSSKYL